MPAAAHAAAAQVGDRSRLASFVQHAPVAPSPRCAVTRKLRQRHVRNEWGPRGSGGPSRLRSGAGDAPGPSERGPCPRPGPKSCGRVEGVQLAPWWTEAAWPRGAGGVQVSPGVAPTWAGAVRAERLPELAWGSGSQPARFCRHWSLSRQR